MNDLFKLSVSIILISIGIFFGFPPLIKIFSAIFKVTISESTSIITVLINFIMIFIMIITIFISNKSSQEEIKSIKESTQSYINKTEEFNKKTKSALLSALLLEFKENIRLVRDTVADRDLYINQAAAYSPSIAFSFETYQANLNNATIDNYELLDQIVKVYSSFRIFQGIFEINKLPHQTKEFREKNIKKVIENMEVNLNEYTKIEQEIASYKKSNYDTNN